VPPRCCCGRTWRCLNLSPPTAPPRYRRPLVHVDTCPGVPLTPRLWLSPLQFLLEHESLSDPSAPSRQRVSPPPASREFSQQPATHVSAAAASLPLPLSSREDKADDDDTISISTVSTLTLPANRRHAPRDDRLVEPTQRPSASTQAVSSAPRSVAALVPRPIVEERPLSLCEGDDDDDHVASYDDVNPPSASTPTGVVLQIIVEERALSLCEGDDDHIASYDDVDTLPAARR